MSRIISTGWRLLLLTFVIAALIVPAAPAVYAESNAPLDTPTPFATAYVEEWSVGNGLAYWSYSCFADEFVSTAGLDRKPTAGGTPRTIERIDDFARCITYLNQLSAANGLYYYDNSQSRIARMPLSEPYTAQTVKALVGNQQPASGKGLVEANGYLYWIGFQQIARTLKNGSGPVETVATISSGLISDFMVIGNTVYWTDEGGIHTISINCATLPCTDSLGNLHRFGASARGYGLLYRVVNDGPIPARGPILYWVERNTSAPFTYKIRNCPISPFMVSCDDAVIGPGSVGAAAVSAVGTFYTATTNWLIGSPLLVNGNLYWTERDISSVSNGTGDIKRKAITATEATPADTIATNQANLDGRLFVANDTLFFARSNNNNTGIYTLSLNASAITRDFEATAFEVTQGIQNLANSTPLVAAKPTYVRAYGKQLAGPSAPNVEARLFGIKNDVSLPGSPLQPVNGARALGTGGSFDRARLNDSWYFLLPPSWIAAGNVILTLEIDGRQIHTDPNRGNNSLTKTVNFQNQPPVCVWTVPVRTHTPKPSTTDPNFWSMVSQFNRRWPVPDTWIFRDTNPVEELQVCWAGPFPYPCHGPYELEDGWGITNGPPDRDKVIISLWTRAQLSFNPDACDDIGAPVHFMGLVHPDANNGGASGYASTVSNQSWVQLPDHTPNPMPAVWNSMREGSTMAQELAHNDGRKHVNCGGPDNIDTGYPYPPCQIANVGADSYYGFDVATKSPIRPNETADFMSYSFRSWVSDYTWRALMNSFLTANVTGASPVAKVAGDSVFVSGLVDTENNRGEVSTVLVLPGASVPLSTRRALALQVANNGDHSAPHATFKLRFLDAGGTVLIERTLTLIHMDDHTADGASALFSDLFPVPTGTVATIQLLADETVIDTITPGAALPTATISQPAAGTTVADTLTIQWQADDADETDQLSFTVQYSHDGGTKWHTLVTNYPSTPAKSYTLTLNDLGGLQGSAPNTARIRVLASDGFNTTIATSGAFTVQNRKPEPAILVPAPGQIFAAGTSIGLQGQATDPEDGGLSGNALIWAVDDVTVGQGAAVDAAGLAPGTHTVVLSATDSISNSGATSVDFTIAPLGIGLAAVPPTLDGFCEDESYATGTALQLQPYGDGSQGTVRLLRTADHLYACFSGLPKGATTPGAFVGLRIDGNHSRDPLAQSSDYGFFVGEDGDVSSVAGDGAGGFSAAGPEGVAGQISAGANSWSAELRIDQATLGGWGHLVGLNAGHYWRDFQGDDYLWPYTTVFNNPSTWATTALGVQPTITALDPLTATVSSSAFTMTVSGSGFISGTKVLWAGAEVPTTFVDEGQLIADIGTGQLSSAGAKPVTARTPDNFASNAIPFQVEALAPVVTTLGPSRLTAGRGATTLTVNGSNFSADAQVLWNGTPLTTQVVSATQVKVQLTADLVDQGQTVGVAVRNGSPDPAISNAAVLEVLPPLGEAIYLPMIQR